MDGNTDDGRYNPTGGAAFSGYPDFTSSPYTLPYPSGDSCYVGQANQGLFSHNALNNNQVYCYDFSLDQDHAILTSRPGTVVDWFDFAPDNQDTPTPAGAVAAPPIAFVTDNVVQDAAADVTIAGAVNVTAGDLILLFAAGADGAATLTPSDTQGNAYTARPSLTAAGLRAQGWFARANATGNVTITVTFDTPVANRIWQVAVFQNATAFFSGAEQTQGGIAGADSVSSGALVTAAANGDLVAGWSVATGGGITLAAGTGFTARTPGAGVAASLFERRQPLPCRQRSRPTLPPRAVSRTSWDSAGRTDQPRGTTEPTLC
jgi:hypothetical protein